MEYKKQRIFDSSVYMNLYKSRPKSKVVGKSGYDGSTCTSWYQLKHNKSANFFDTQNTISENKEHKSPPKNITLNIKINDGELVPEENKHMTSVNTTEENERAKTNKLSISYMKINDSINNNQLMTVNQIKSKDVSTDKAISRFEYVIQLNNTQNKDEFAKKLKESSSSKIKGGVITDHESNHKRMRSTMKRVRLKNWKSNTQENPSIDNPAINRIENKSSSLSSSRKKIDSSFKRSRNEGKTNSLMKTDIYSNYIEATDERVIKDIADVHTFYQNHVIYDYEEKIEQFKKVIKEQAIFIKQLQSESKDLHDCNIYLEGCRLYYRKLMAEKADILKKFKERLCTKCSCELEYSMELIEDLDNEELDDEYKDLK